ncbi:MAG: polysaccharide biosynthesis tyrosine autokinase [Bacteroidaceae bacterium]|nr:polysaccharide biosynthesis tyrosine autokinase [Bacteroidaceae bacterium]
MAEFNEKDFLQKEEEGNGLFSLKSIWTLFYQNWYWVLLSVIVCLCFAVVYLRYKAPVYSVSMKVLIKDSEQNKRSFSGMGLDEMGLLSSSNGFDNELEILTSATVATRVVKRLKLYVTYSIEGSVVDTELYRNSPVAVDLEESCLENIKKPVPLILTKSKEGVKVEGCFDPEDPELVTYTRVVTQLPANLESPAGMLLLQSNILLKQDAVKADPVSEAWNDGHKLMVTIYPPKMVGRMYSKGRLNAASTSKTTTVANVSLVDTKRDRALDYLNELLDCYNEDANEDKNEVARKTEEFISERLNSIREELDETEGSMETYKKTNELINLSNDATTALQKTTDYRKELVSLQTQLSLLKSLMDYMDSPDNYLQIIPVNLGLGNTAMITPLVTTITKFNEMVLNRNRYLKGSGEDNPMVVQMTHQLSDMWPTIRQNMKNIYDNMETQKNSIAQQYELYSGRILKTPTQERVLTNITRRQSLQSELYLTLLQKREENYIQLYSTAAKARIIEEPYVLGKVSPKSNMVLGGAFLLGVCIPMGILLGLNLLRTKVESRDEVELLTKLPILADIPLARGMAEKDRAIVVRENRNNMMEEAFRGLRTNMNFVLKPGERVVMFTSCVPGEGKTFVASNLAMSLALMGKKVIIVGLDVRKPRLVNLFKLKKGKQGIVNFLCGNDADFELLEKQIIPSGINENMDVLPAGVIPPNPAELLSGPLLKSAIDYLASKYDYVILDTPPVGLVADTLAVGHLANVTIFVTRAKYTPKSTFELINDIHVNHKLPNCNIVINSVDFEKRQYGYSSGYKKYGYYGMYGTYGQGDGDQQFRVED